MDGVPSRHRKQTLDPKTHMFRTITRLLFAATFIAGCAAALETRDADGAANYTCSLKPLYDDGTYAGCLVSDGETTSFLTGTDRQTCSGPDEQSVCEQLLSNQ